MAAIVPFTHGRWAAADPQATRAALATFGAPVLLLAGELDPSQFAATIAAFPPRSSIRAF